MLEDKLRKCLSTKAIKIGKEHGVTAEFIVQQTSEQFFNTMDEVFMLFDAWQECLYSNDPAVQSTQNKEGQGQRVIYEESILMTLLGPDYLSLISQETGEWSQEDMVKFKF